MYKIICINKEDLYEYKISYKWSKGIRIDIHVMFCIINTFQFTLQGYALNLYCR